MKAQIQCRISSEYLRDGVRSLGLANYETDFGGAYAWQDFDTLADARAFLAGTKANNPFTPATKDSISFGGFSVYIVTDKSKFWRKEQEVGNE